MPKAPLYNANGEKIGEVDLKDDVFGLEMNKALLHQAVVMQLASRRRGTAKTKTIGEVSGGGRKPWRQKGTGRARHGSIRSPLWVGGATIFGPQPRSYSYNIPKKARRLALKTALSAKAVSEEVAVIEEFKFEQAKTKDMVKLLEGLGAGRGALIVVSEPDRNVELSARNIPDVKTVLPEGLNVYDLMYFDKLIFTKDSLEKIEEVYA